MQCQSTTFQVGILAVTILAVAACGAPFERQAGAGADYVYHNGDIYTVDGHGSWAEAVAVNDGRISYVGDKAGAQEFIGRGTKIVNLKGNMMLPGFIDTHAHPVLATGLSGALVLDFNASPDEWLDDIRKYAKKNKDQPYLFGFGFHAGKFGPNGPTKDLLDAIVPDKPVLIIDGGGHSAWANSRAFDLGGIGANTPDPVPGVHYYKRDEAGEPTGWCLEAMTIYPLMLDLGMASTEKIITGSGDVFWLMGSAGITTMFDAGMTVFEDQGYPALTQLDEAGELPFRVVTSHMVQDPKQIPGAVERLRLLKEKYETDLIRPTTIKIHNDGTVEAMTAAIFEPYNGQPVHAPHRGGIMVQGEPLKALVKDSVAAGFDLHIHAIGDHAVAEALDAIEDARAAYPETSSRFSIAHIQLVRDSDLKRFGELDAVAHTTPVWFATKNTTRQEVLGQERASKLNRFKSIQDGGARLSFGSDFPASGLKGVFPIYNIEVGITRKVPGAEDMATYPPADERLDLNTMIEGYTINAAYQLNLENEIGSIEVGKQADFVTLNQNLFEVDPADIHKVKVKSTILNGEVTYKRSLKTKFFEMTAGL